MLSKESLDDTKKVAQQVGRGLLSRFKKGADDGSPPPPAPAPPAPPRDLPEPTSEDAVVVKMLQFVRESGEEAVAGTRLLALMSKTLRHINARCRELKRRRRGGSMVSNTSMVGGGGGASIASALSDRSQEAAGGDDSALLDEISAFFARLPRIRFKRDPALAGTEETSDLSLELFPALRTIEVTGITVVHVRGGDSVTHVVMNEGASVVAGVAAFPKCTHLEITATDAAPILSSVGSQITHLRIVGCPGAGDALVGADGALLPCLTGLSMLSVCGCDAEAVPAALAELPLLRKLSLAGNLLTSIRGLRANSELRELDLSRNRLRSLEELGDGDCISTGKLAALDVSANRQLTTTVGLDSETLPALTTLAMAQCGIADWGEVSRLRGLLGLEHIRLQDNPVCTRARPDEFRLLVLELLPYIPRPADFKIDGQPLQRHELMHWQQRHERDAPGTAEERLKAAAAAAAKPDEQQREAAAPPQAPARQGSTIDTIDLDAIPAFEIRGSPRRKGRQSPRVKPAIDPISPSSSAISPPTSPTVSVKRVVKKKKRSVHSQTDAPEPDPARAVQPPSAPAVRRTTVREGPPTTSWDDRVLRRLQDRLSTASVAYPPRVTSLAPSEWSSGELLCSVAQALAGGAPGPDRIPCPDEVFITHAFGLAQERLKVPAPAEGREVVREPHRLALYLSDLMAGAAELDLERSKRVQQLSGRLHREVERFRAQLRKDRRDAPRAAAGTAGCETDSD
eukprot:TRINITY_DN6874_c1_g1_i1.p1 TRINITY_DN6874_c1_g1~~TRINITY_DN6874_c1_g1_i1.p1  ORF type:complete len:741 (+),score=233.26 TRINITY_DN6874_c1_g1_i1:101-2323(+)